MSKKLLNEVTRNRWMKLANINSSLLKESYEEDMDEVKTQNQSRAGGAPDRLDEMDDELPSPDVSSEPSPESEPHVEPGGDEPVGEATVEDLVAALAQTMTDVTGVPVEVEGSTPDEMPPSNDVVPSSEPVGDEPVAETTVMAEEVETPKKSTPADQGQPKDSMKSQVRVDGAEKPQQMEGTSKDPAGKDYKTLEEKIYRRVLERLIKEVKDTKLKKSKKK